MMMLFPRAGLAGHRIKLSIGYQAELIDDGVIADGKLFQHGFRVRGLRKNTGITAE